MEKFAKRLNELLKDKNISNDEIVKLLNLASVNSLYPWLNGKKYPIVKYMVMLADFFNCSVEYLLGRTEEIGDVKYNKPKPFNIQLKKIMDEKNKTQYKMEQDGICNSGHFHWWFKIKSVPRFETIIKLADYFGVTIDYLLGRE